MSRSQTGITGYQLAYQSNFSDDESDSGSDSGGEFVGATVGGGDDETAVVKRLDFDDGGGDLKKREFREMGFGFEREEDRNRGFGLRIRGDGTVHVARAASMVGGVVCVCGGETTTGEEDFEGVFILHSCCVDNF